MKKLLSMALVVCIVLSMAACGAPAADKDAGAAASGGEIYIGILAPLTGDVAIYGQSVYNAAQLAFAEINAAGGVAGKTFKYEVFDEKGDPTEAVNGYNKLTGQGVDFILGDVTSKPTLAIAETAAADRIPMLTATSSHADVTTYGDNIFRSCYIDPFQGMIQAKFAAETLGVKKVAVLYNTSDDYSDGIKNTFVSTAESLGLEVVAVEGYSQDDKDFKTQLTKIQSAGAEAIALPDYYNRTALVATQMVELGIDVPLIGPDGVDGVLDVVDPANVGVLNNVYFTNHYFVGDPNEKIQNFVKNYTKEYGAAPNALAALGYDGVYILAAAYEATGGDTDKEKVIAALAQTDYTGVTGRVAYNKDADMTTSFVGDPAKSVSIIHIQDGVYELAATVAP